MKEIIEISRLEFAELLKDAKTLILDIRENEEFTDFNVGGINVPAHLLSSYYEILEKQEKIIVVCSNGMRSSIISRVLNKKLKNTTILHLSEGLF